MSQVSYRTALPCYKTLPVTRAATGGALTQPLRSIMRTLERLSKLGCQTETRTRIPALSEQCPNRLDYLTLVGRAGFEPTYSEEARFTVWCTSPSVPPTQNSRAVFYPWGAQPSVVLVPYFDIRGY